MPGYELIGAEEQKAVAEVFETGGVLYRYGLDQKRQGIFRVDEFEKQIARRVNARHALFVCNGTAALKLGLIALGVGPGDEVITQSFTFIATVEAILEVGAVPVIADIDQSLNMDPRDMERRITRKTKAIIPVHMAGVPARMDEIMRVAKARGIPVFEDSAQALGAAYQGKPLGTIGSMGVYSLDIGKVITTGEGGVLVTNDDVLFRRAREYSDHGHEQNPAKPRGEDTRTRWGFNYKATELQGAVGLAQLAKLNGIIASQRAHKQAIMQCIIHAPGISFRDVPDPDGDAGDTLVFFCGSRDSALAFAQKLRERSIGTKNLPDAINWHFAGTWTHIFGRGQGVQGADLEKVWAASAIYLRRAIALPIMVGMEDARIAQYIDAINSIAGELA